MTPEHPAPESLVHERCYRCRAVVPNGLVTRRMMKTGYGTRSGDTYQNVSLCGVCDLELREEETRKGYASCRHWGVLWGTVALAYAGVIWPIGLALMCVLAWYRMVGRALLALVAVAVFYFQTNDYPANIQTSFVLPWAIATGVLAAGKIGGKLARKGLAWKRPLMIGGHQ